MPSTDMALLKGRHIISGDSIDVTVLFLLPTSKAFGAHFRYESVIPGIEVCDIEATMRGTWQRITRDRDGIKLG